MLKTKDVLIYVAYTVAFFVVAQWVMYTTRWPVLVLPLFLLYFTLHILIKRQKRIMPYVQQDFKDLGYELLAERPLKWSEVRIVSEMRIASSASVAMRRLDYARRFERVFRVKKTTGELIDLQATITHEWGGQNTIEIVSEEEVGHNMNKG